MGDESSTQNIFLKNNFFLRPLKRVGPAIIAIQYNNNNNLVLNNVAG